MKKIILIAMAFITFGCSSNDPINDPMILETIDVGVVIDADVVATSFNESMKLTVKTDKGVFTVRGIFAVFIGDKATIDRYDNGRNYLCLTGWGACMRINIP